MSNYCPHCGTDGLHVEGCPTKPLWQMDVRYRLGLDPAKNDTMSSLLFSTLYSSGSQQDFRNAITEHVKELLRVVEILDGGKGI